MLEPGRAGTQVRDEEEAVGIAAQHQKQTEFWFAFFFAGLGRAHKGHCCELNAVCSWQLRVQLCRLGCAFLLQLGQQPPFPWKSPFLLFVPGEECGPAAEEDQSQLWSGVL